MAANTSHNVVHDVACPFCGLLCDDLVVATDEKGEISRCENACEYGRQQFNEACRSGALCEPALTQKRHSQADAIERAAQLLTTARAPMIAGLATDVAGMRAAVRLAELTGAGLDHMNGRAIVRNQRVLQRTGWFTTTLTEIRNRADLVILIDDQILDDYPRLLQRVLKPQSALLAERADSREIIAINEGDSAKVAAAGVDESFNTASTLDLLFELRSCLQQPQGQCGGAAKALCQRIQDSAYTVFIWSAGRLASEQADLIIDTVGDIVRTINVDRRAASLPIAGSRGDLTANQVCTWQTGLPLRLQFVDGKAHADLVELDVQQRVAAGDTDCLIWIDSMTSTAVPDGAASTIVIGTPAHAQTQADVFIPVDTPGVGVAGLMVRTDNVVTVPLSPVRAPRYPSVAEVLNQLYEAVLSRHSQQVATS